MKSTISYSKTNMTNKVGFGKKSGLTKKGRLTDHCCEYMNVCACLLALVRSFSFILDGTAFTSEVQVVSDVVK